MIHSWSENIIDFTSYIDTYSKNFIGREWLFEELNQWLTESDQRYFIITGEPGIGKSAIAAQLARTYNPAASHFCIGRQTETIDPRTFAHCISQQLQQRLDGFGKCIAEDINIRVDGQANVQENNGQAFGVFIGSLNASSAQVVFTHSVINPLKKLYNQGFEKQLVILVDSLDEARQHTGQENIVDLLANLVGLPPKVRFVLTSREDNTSLRNFEKHSTFYLLDANSQENRGDIRSYVQHQLDASEYSEQLQRRLSAQKIRPQAFVNEHSLRGFKVSPI